MKFEPSTFEEGATIINVPSAEQRVAELERRLQRCLEWAQHYSGDKFYRLAQIEREASGAFNGPSSPASTQQ